MSTRRPQAATRLAGECPRCKSPLVRRTRRTDGNAFLSCSGYPACKFAEDWDPHVARLSEDVDALRSEVAQLRSELARGRRSSHTPDISRELRDVIAFAHPDRWPQSSDLAHGIAARLNALRGRL